MGNMQIKEIPIYDGDVEVYPDIYTKIKYEVDNEKYFKIAKNINELASVHSGGRVISFLEGGYDLIALSESIKEYINGLNYL